MDDMASAQLDAATNKSGAQDAVTTPAATGKAPDPVDLKAPGDNENENDDESDEEEDWYSDSDVSEVPAEAEGYLHRKFESSYLAGSKKHESQQAQIHGVCYDRCTAAELRRFVRERGLADPFPEGVTMKYYYIRLLEQADEGRLFHKFMDLPPEMRLLVYRELLLFSTESSEKRTAHTAILRSSRQVNEEAQSILYEENTLVCKFMVDVQDDHGVVRSAAVHNTTSTAGCPHAPYLRLPKGIDDYPEYFRRVTSLHIEIVNETHGHAMGDAPYWYWLNHYLLTFASFLMEGHRLKSLHIDAHLAEMEVDNIAVILYPLRRLRNIQKVTMSGVLEKFARRLRKDLQDFEPAFNTLRQYKLLSDLASAQLTLITAVAGDPDCACGECPPPMCYDSVGFPLFDVRESETDCCFSSYQEEKFIARLAALRDRLDELDVQGIEELIKEVKVKERAVKDYAAGTDARRLDGAARIWEDVDFDDEIGDPEDVDWSDTDDDSMPSLEDHYTRRVATHDTAEVEPSDDLPHLHSETQLPSGGAKLSKPTPASPEL